MLKRLPIDLPELAGLFDQPRGGPVRAFFDRHTGELESMPRDAEVEGVFDDIVNTPARWIEITPLPLAERLALRRRFVDDEVTDAHLRLRLCEVLAAERPLTRFEALLRERTTLHDRWFAWRAAALATLALAWLAALGIEPARPGAAQPQ